MLSGRYLLCVSTLPSRQRKVLRTDINQRARPPNSIMATDGTYTRPLEIFNEFSAATTFAGLVLISDAAPHNRLAAIRFQPPLTKKRVFDTELAAIAFGLHHYAGPLLSDCQGAISAAYSQRPSNATAAAAHADRRRIRWTPSHPERRRDKELWTSADYAIYEADKVAEGIGDFDAMPFTQVSEICLINTRLWVIMGPDGATLEAPLLLKQQHNIASYLTNRVKHGRAVWSQAGLQLLLNTASTIPQRGALAKLHLSHFQADHQHNNNTRKRCRCGCRDILTDWLGGCTRPDVMALNKCFLKTLSNLDIPRSMSLAMYPLLEGPDNVLLFRGIWTPDCQTKIRTAFASTPQATIRTWRKSIAKVTILLTSHALSLQHLVSSTALPVVSSPTLPPTELERYFCSSAATSAIAAVVPVVIATAVPSPPFAFIYSTTLRCDIVPNPESRKEVKKVVKTGTVNLTEMPTISIVPKVKSRTKGSTGTKRIDKIFTVVNPRAASSYQPPPFPPSHKKPLPRMGIPLFTSLDAKVDLSIHPPERRVDIRPFLVHKDSNKTPYPPSSTSNSPQPSVGIPSHSIPTATDFAPWFTHPP